jgi:RNA polymerase sigma factor (sigma-70 family)
MQRSVRAGFYAGDGAVLESLVASLEPMLRRTIASYVGAGSDEADDLLSEICLKIFNQRRTYRGEGSIGAWARQLCAKSCVDHLRGEARYMRRIASIGELSDADWDSRSDADRTRLAEAIEQRLEAVTDAVVALPPRARAMAISHWYLGQKPSRIAREFHVSARTVWTTLSQVRAKLRRKLAPVARAPSLTPI